MSVNVVICAGARADILDEDERTPLYYAEEHLAEKSQPENRQQLEKVQQGKHTPHLGNISPI